jgi:osmotically-inducible protein OsmY
MTASRDARAARAVASAEHARIHGGNMKTHALLLPAVLFCGCSGDKDTHAAEKPSHPAYEHSESKAPPKSPTASTQTETDSDRQLVENIRKALSDNATTAEPSKDIQVSALSGTVTLRGTVDDADAKNSIEQAVRAVPGVRELDDQLKTKNP